MKRSILLLFAFCIGTIINAQNSIPNGNFENWKSNTFECPSGYPFSSNPNTFYYYKTGFNAVKTTDAFHGNFAVQLSTLASKDTAIAYFLGIDPMNGNPQSWHGGIPYSQKPAGIRGYYKYNVASADSAVMVVVFSKGGVSVGSYFYTIGGIKNAYTLFDFTFSPALSVTPDSVIIGAASSNFQMNNGKGVAGSILKIDSISFTGVTAQPAAMNGDFESWVSQSIDEPINWTMEGGSGTTKTTDAAAGLYAVDLKTYSGDENNVQVARPGYISNGTHDQACNCLKGGFPFTNKIDTLKFAYKFTPAKPTDSAEIDMTFKQTGVYIYGIRVKLPATAVYKAMSLPFNTNLTPDSVIFSAMSSDHSDTALSFVGAEMKIDEIHFASQPLHTGIGFIKSDEPFVQIYPNPFRSNATLTIGNTVKLDGMHLKIYDVLGNILFQREVLEHQINIDNSLLTPGTLFYILTNNEGEIKRGKIIIE